MKLRKGRAAAVAGGVAVLSAVAATTALGNAVTGPSSSQSPYVVRSQPGVVTESILTVGDEVPKAGGGTYRMVGIPDGLGAFGNGDGTFTLLSNHELGTASGIPRAHGAAGAFVSRWVIDGADLSVRSGEDLIHGVARWDAAAGAYLAPAPGIALDRFCSADLAPVSAFYDAASGKGHDGRLFTNGEEVGGGRAYAHALDGTSYELPAMGKLNFENVVAHPGTGETTVAVGTDDSTPGQVYLYKGTKQTTGNPVEKAGLNNGALYGVKVPEFTDERTATLSPDFSSTFSAAPLGDVRAKTGGELETASDAAGVTEFWRPEDAAWDPTDPRVLYFVTTASFSNPSRLWRLTFADPAQPELGGRIDLMLDGTEGQHMFDNIAVNEAGQVLLQEDPGGNDHIARVHLYSPQADQLAEVAHFDEARFAPGAPGFLTKDEESSGIIDAAGILGRGWYLLDVQAHYTIPGELVQGGQYLAMHVPPGKYPV